MANTYITKEHKAESARLNKIYLKRKDETGITQVQLAKKLGIKQGSVSLFLRGKMSLNTDMIIRMSKILRFDPSEVRRSIPSAKKVAIESRRHLIDRLRDYSLEERALIISEAMRPADSEDE